MANLKLDSVEGIDTNVNARYAQATTKIFCTAKAVSISDVYQHLESLIHVKLQATFCCLLQKEHDCYYIS